MMNVSAAKSLLSLKNSFLFAVLLSFLVSCTVVKDYPNKPFVYKTTIDIQGKYSTDEKKELTQGLVQQMHDSIRVRSVQKLIGWVNGPKFFYSEIKKPAVYDSLNADKSTIFMRALLNSLGYYRDSISHTNTVHLHGDQYRTTVKFAVIPGTLFKLDSIAYNIGRDTLLKITQQEKDTLQEVSKQVIKGSLLKRGEPFAKPLLSSERDRFTDEMRNNGYLRFSNDDLRVIWDTVGIALLRPTLDPIEQAQLLDALRRRRANPVADVEYRLRPNLDTVHLTRYYVGNVIVYPDLTPDTAFYIPTIKRIRNKTIITYHNLFRSRVILENTYFNRGDLYRQSNYLKTLNRFNSLGTFRLVSIDAVPRPAIDTVDFVIKLTPANQFIFEFNIEGSQNWGTLFTKGNLIGLNFGVQNRNLNRGANISNTNIRIGTEINPDRFIQTQQISLSHTITFPRAIPRFKFIPPALKENIRTSLASNLSYINRLDFLELLTINGSWGYRINWKNKLFSLRLPNIEYTFLDRKTQLTELIRTNQSYKYIFNDGLVASVIGAFTRAGNRKNKTSSLYVNAELSGLPAFIKSKFLDSNLYRFIKLDADYRQTHTIRRSAFAWRIFGGVGYSLPRSSKDSMNMYMPFFRAYSAGGANSMRAWPLRKLGPGRTVRSFAVTDVPDRFGDLQLELNAEYRFYITDIGGVKINSALFTDIGNIWYLRKNNDFKDGTFNLDSLWRDLGIGAGTGLRIDFGIFLVRLDFAYKLKDPSPADVTFKNKFFPYRRLADVQLQLGINYPF